MHCSYRVDVAAVLREGDNALAVTFAPAVAYAQAGADRLGALPHVDTAPNNVIRKMACSELRVECADEVNQSVLASTPVLRCINDVEGAPPVSR